MCWPAAAAGQVSIFADAKADARFGALFLAARGFDLRLTSWLLQGFFAVAAIVLVVVFQDDAP